MIRSTSRSGIRRYRRHTIAAGVVLALLAGPAGCGGGSDDDGRTTLRFVWWGNDDRATATKAAVASFEKQHPDIKVETEYSAYDAYYQKLSTQIAGGSAPDLFQLDRPNLGDFQGRQALARLDTEGDDLKVDQIAPELLAGGKVGGQLYAIPAGQLTQMLVYDPAAFAKADVDPPAGTWSWQQFGDAMVRVSATGVAGTTDFGWAIDWFEVYLHQQGKSLYTEDGKLGFTTADLTAFWNFTAALRGRKALTPPEVTTKMDGSMPNSGLITKKSASEINYDSSLTAYLGAYGAPLKTTALPSDTTTSGMAAMPSVSFAVANRSKHKKTAIQLLNFLINDPEAGKILNTTRGLPENLQIRAQVCAAATGAAKAVCDYEEAVKDRVGPAFGAWPKGSATIKRDFQKEYDDVIFGRVSVAEGAKRVVEGANQSLTS